MLKFNPLTAQFDLVSDPATSLVSGTVILTGDFGGTASSPQVVATHLASALPINQGGTAATSASGATTNLLPSQTGNSGKLLSTDGLGTLSWQAAGGTGTVTSVSVASANGFSGTVANATTTPAITIIAGAITPTSVNGVVLSGASTPTLAVTGTTTVSGSNTGDQTITLTSDVTGSGTGSFATTIRSSVALAGSPTTTTQSPTDNSTKIATTAYVTTGISNAIAGVNPAVAVQWATTAAGDTSGLTYSNGASGVGATMTGTNNTVTTIDGHTFVVGDVGVTRLLIKNDTQAPSGAFNGVYLFTALHTAGTGDIFTRATDYNTPSDINNTGAIPVVNGTANALTSWLLTSAVATVGTDPLTYSKFSINPTTQLTTTLTSAHLLVGNNSNVATDTAITGDVTISNSGVTTIGAGRVTDSMLTGTVTPAHGGTGIANNNSSTLTISGSFATTLTVTATTGVTLPTSGTLATLAGSETLSNKILSDAFMGNSFQSQTATTEVLTLTASTVFVYNNILEVGATNTLEIPSTSSLEIAAYMNSSDGALTNATLTDTFMGQVFDAASGITRNVTLTAATDFIAPESVEISTNYTIEIPINSTMEISGYATSANLRTDQFYNPYKFSVYRSAAFNVTNAFAKVQFDTKNHDTSSNFDAVTNFRFTAPVGGFYHFSWVVGIPISGTTDNVAALYKNGLVWAWANEGTAGGSSGSIEVQALAGDYFEIWVVGSATIAANVGNAPQKTWFSGFLVSLT